jgi:hypothetical protein
VKANSWVAANTQTIVNSDPVLDPAIRAVGRLRLNSCISTPGVSNSLVGVSSLFDADPSLPTTTSAF